VPTSNRLAQHRPVDFRQPAVGRVMRDRIFKQRGFARAIASDQAEHFAMADFQPPRRSKPRKFLAGLAQGSQRRAEPRAKEDRARFPAADYTTAVAFTETFGAYDDVRHCRLVYL